MTQPHMSLCPRGDQVARLLATGATNSEIALELGIALRTVKAHCNRLYLRYRVRGHAHKRVRLVISMLGAQPPSAPVGMRSRLTRVCDLVVLGLTNQEIAETIGTTESVVKNHLRVIYNVTGTFSRLEFAIFWNSHGAAPQAIAPTPRMGCA
jgi:DNA-binding NarL/FixJ family response regulator